MTKLTFEQKKKHIYITQVVSYEKMKFPNLILYNRKYRKIKF